MWLVTLIVHKVVADKVITYHAPEVVKRARKVGPFIPCYIIICAISLLINLVLLNDLQGKAATLKAPKFSRNLSKIC